MCVTIQQALHPIDGQVEGGGDEAGVYRANLRMLTADLQVGATKFANDHSVVPPFVLRIEAFRRQHLHEARQPLLHGEPCQLSGIFVGHGVRNPRKQLDDQVLRNMVLHLGKQPVGQPKIAARIYFLGLLG